MQTQSFMVDVPGGQVFVQRWQPASATSGAACPIVLLHESLGSVGQWHDFPARLAQATGREVLAYDRLGFGQSSPRSGAPSLQFIEHDAQQHFPALMAALGLERYALLGHSVGAVMALHIAAAHPAQCQAVLSLSAQAYVQPQTLEGIRPGQVGAMCEAVGLTVVQLKRIRIGRLPLARLPEGHWRYVLPWEKF